jgi:ceramide synthetase
VKLAEADILHSPAAEKMCIAILFLEILLTVWSVATVEQRLGRARSSVPLMGYSVSELHLFLSFFPVVVTAVYISQAIFGVGGQWFSRTVLAKTPFLNPLAKRKSLAKFKAQSWQLVVHFAMSVFEWYVIADEEWFDDGTAGVYPPPPTQVNKPMMSYLYMGQLAIWIYTCVCHIWLFEKQKDYWVMLGHHLATIGLVGLSYHFNYVRYGTMVLWVHDVSDIPGDALKMVNYLKLSDAAGFFITEFFFVAVLVSWAYFRLYVFPVKVIYQATGPWLFLLQNLEYCKDNVMSYHNMTSVYADATELNQAQLQEICSAVLTGEGDTVRHFSAIVANVLLVLLFCMSCFWYSMFIKILYKILSKNPLHEIAEEEYEGASDDEVQ